jgi:hypothetical protein
MDPSNRRAEVALPNPEEKPTVSLWPTAGQAIGLSRTSTYEAARRGEIPTIRVGKVIRVPTAALRRMLQLDEPLPAA